MPPKEVTNIINGTLYFEDENGELKPICMASELSEVEITEDMDAEVLSDSRFRFTNNVLSTEYHFGFDLDKFAYKMLVKMHQNNYRRLHGLRPVRHKVQRHKPENSLFTVKRIRGGFKFK